MDTVCHSPEILSERLCKWLFSKAKQNSLPLLTALITGTFAHMFAFTNKLVNHDEVFCLFSKGGTVTSGRWGLGLLDAIFPNYSMPWIYGIVSLLLIAAAVCLMVHIFTIRSKLLQGLLAGIVVSFPSLTGTFGYMFTSSSYALAFFLAVLAVWLIRQQKKWFLFLSLGCMVFSLSIYQSYISVTASLLVLILIQDLFSSEGTAAVIRRGIAYVIFLLLSLAGYYLVTQLILRITGTSFNSYASSSMTFQLSSVLKGISLAYSNFLLYITESHLGLIPTGFSRVLHAICLLLTGVLLLLKIRCFHDLLRSLLLLCLVLILPLAINCMYLITAPESIHTLVMYSFVSFYVFILMIADSTFLCSWQFILCFCQNAISIILAAVIAVNVYIANQAYLNLHLRYENAYAFYTALISDIKQEPEFVQGTKLAIIGKYQDPEHFTQHFEDTDRITGVHGFLPDSYSADRFLKYYIGLDIPFASEDEILSIQNTPEFAEMAIYPYYGSNRMFGDILVVKLN